MDLKHAIESYSAAANSPSAWASAADGLLAAADVLRERRTVAERDDELARGACRTHPPELMLRGMAIECLLKAVWVARGQALVENGEYKRIPKAQDHDLQQLAAALGLRLSDLESDVLLRLSTFIRHGGRYPIPKRATELLLVASPRGGRTATTTWTTPQDYDICEGIVRQLNTLLEEPSA